VINGRYRVEDVLGRGGMGVVMSARDLHRDAPVALKVPHRVRGRDVARLVAEARAVERLSSVHVAKLYEAGTFDDNGIAIPFLALEYVDGVDLATWLRARGRIAPAEAAAIVLQACDAIGEAHAHGLVHRDVKPANLMLTASPAGELVVKVLDFGIARAAGNRGADEHGLTATGELVGSPSYMAPEQLRPSDAVDARSDVWALGVVLFEAIAGRPPFEAAALPELCLHILLDEPPPLPADCPAAIADVVRRCLDKLPEARFQSASELADGLRPSAASAPAMRPEDLELATLAPVADDDAASMNGVTRVRSSKRAIVLGVFAAAIAGVLAMSRHVAHPLPTAGALPQEAMIRESVRPKATYVANDVEPPEKRVTSSARRTRGDKRTHVPPVVAPSTAGHEASAPDPLASPF
jgi:serine/threonine-protein kinase